MQSVLKPGPRRNDAEEGDCGGRIVLDSFLQWFPNLSHVREIPKQHLQILKQSVVPPVSGLEPSQDVNQEDRQNIYNERIPTK